MEQAVFLGARTKEGGLFLNLANITAVRLEGEAGVGSQLLVTVYVTGGNQFVFEGDPAGQFLELLQQGGKWVEAESP